MGIAGTLKRRRNKMGREKTEVRVGIVGAGFISARHAACLKRIFGVAVRVSGVADTQIERARALAERCGADATDDYRRLLDRDDVDVILNTTPTFLHAPVSIDAARAGKHVICEKPFTGYCGPELPEDVGRTVPRRDMLGVAVDSARRMVEAARTAGVRLMYAENWVHAPAFAKMKEVILASKGAILDLRAEESHGGSHSPFAKHWRWTGGGALLRTGSHPFGGVIHLKRAEGMARSGSPYTVRSVIADVATLTHLPAYLNSPRAGLTVDLDDTEDWSVAVLTFSDGTRATIHSTDLCVGGVQNRVEAYLSNGRVECSIQHGKHCTAFAPGPETFRDSYFAEMVQTNAGWGYPEPEEERAIGYQNEMQNFMEAVAFDRDPITDGELGLETVKAMYAAYVSAEEGRRVDLTD
jgi:predicted dehydrogenase